MIRKAVIPAAGFGSRFLPATKAQPKEMLPIIDTPTIQYVIDETVQSGISQILVITGKGKQAIENHFDRSFELAPNFANARHSAGLTIAMSDATARGQRPGWSSLSAVGPAVTQLRR